MIVSVIGLGYVGLPTAALIASNNIKVNGFDINPKIIKSINNGECHISEPKLDKLIKKAVDKKYLNAFASLKKADVYIIAVPTPFKKNFKPDLSYLKKAIKSTIPLLKRNDLIIIESTCPVGTSQKMMSYIYKEREDLRPTKKNKGNILNLSFAYCPERVLPGQAINEMINNNRIIGSNDTKSSLKARKVYQIFSKGKLLETDLNTAEMVKITENCFRDLNIGFANELSLISDKLKLDVYEVIKLSNFHPRINILNPGIGVGGHCIAVDPYFLINSDKINSRLISTARKVNISKTAYVTRKINSEIKKLFNKNNGFKINIGVLGLSYKPDVNDFRESPAVKILNDIQRDKINNIFLVEPYLESLDSIKLKKKYQINLCSIDSAIKNTSFIVILVNHKKFHLLPKLNTYNKNILDAVGFLNKHAK